MGFFPQVVKDKPYPEPADEGAFVVPLLVTDNLEGTLKSRTIDTIRQFALALSFLQGGVAGNLGMSRMREEINSVLGTDINSLYTVGRVTDNTVQIRLGAARQATAGYAMLPRNHSITLLVMVPEKVANDDRPSVRVVTNTVMRDAETGKLLKQQPRSARLGEIKKVLKVYVGGDLPEVKSAEVTTRCQTMADELKKMSCETDPQLTARRDSFKTDCQSEASSTETALTNLLNKIYGNDYASFVRILKAAGWDKGLRRDLWLDMVETLGRSEYAGAGFELPRVAQPELPVIQPVVADDDKKKLTVRVFGGGGLVAGRLRARLIVGLKGSKPEILAATSAKVGAGGGDPVLEFISPAGTGLGKLDLSGNQINDGELRLAVADDARWSATAAGTLSWIKYPTVLYKFAEAPKDHAYAITKTAELIKADKNNGTGKLAVHVVFGKDPKTKAQRAHQVVLTLSNALITKVASHEDANLTHRLGKVTTFTDGTVTFDLANLDKAKKVVVKSAAQDANKKPVGVALTDLEFEVKAD